MLIKALRLKELSKLAACLCLAAVLITCPQLSLSGVKEGIGLCSYAVIPTVFPFMVLSKYVIYSGNAARLSRILGAPCSRLFGFPPAGAAALILGMVGGYPIGASAICDLVKSKKITPASGEIMLSYCNNCSPLFIIGTVGAVLLKDRRSGIILYIIHIFSALACAYILRNSFPPHLKAASGTAAKKQSSPFISAVSDASLSVISICGYIIFFSVINKILALIPFKSDLLQALLCGILEISNGTLQISVLTLNPVFKYALISAVLGFSGICVLLQSGAAVSGAGLSLKPFVSGKLLCAAISFAAAYVVFGVISLI